MSKEKIISLTDGLLNTANGKTTHGLIHGSTRFQLCCVVDSISVGKDAGEILDGKKRNIPVFASVEQAMTQLSEIPTTCVVGVATHGGILTATLKEGLRSAILAGLNIVNGLHSLVEEDPELMNLAKAKGVSVLDIRKPKPYASLKAWEGEIYQVKTPRIAVMGTDCAIGKRTTAVMLYNLCNENKIKAQMVYTGQSGWMQGFKYGFILDSTLNDFVSGELEHAIVTCDKETSPDLILIEGQSSLRNPSGPCGAEFICSGGATGVILQHVPERTHYNHGPNSHSKMPSLESEIALINMLGATVIGICFNTKTDNILTEFQGIPVVRPRQQGVEALLPAIRAFLAKPKTSVYED
ncbi:MAG: DUF1611 domain-containing protein [Candidatus Berkiella sp.]